MSNIQNAILFRILSNSSVFRFDLVNFRHKSRVDVVKIVTEIVIDEFSLVQRFEI
ncbi:hypothetical protein SAMN05421738_1072 [Algoriella xinjiangensis]|uniref:Uncharacterized protein n=1 Tax=Algoriella xinjiangensis TaxID=684065 RepID=A0A1I4WHY0_9FLAO|nr:hypothetical protein [Algoriella xinjiangensis]SFN12873.1 hypothetical protein SAMN05421738_1072 [Algoriella xinjiangensis]VDH16929.1 Uncharacterised protein [Algoriella xinjiangensis]